MGSFVWTLKFENDIREALKGKDMQSFCQLVTSQNVNSFFICGNSIAFQATLENNLAALEHCIAVGAHLDLSIRFDRWVPLHIAARHGFIEAAQVLLDHGANVNAKTFCGSSVITFARLQRHVPESVIELLIDRGCTFTSEDFKVDMVRDCFNKRTKLRHNIINVIGVFKYKFQRVVNTIDINVVQLIGKHVWSCRISR